MVVSQYFRQWAFREIWSRTGWGIHLSEQRQFTPISMTISDSGLRQKWPSFQLVFHREIWQGNCRMVPMVPISPRLQLRRGHCKMKNWWGLTNMFGSCSAWEETWFGTKGAEVRILSPLPT